MNFSLMRLPLATACFLSVAFADSWPDWRGPGRDGVSRETGLPERWSPAGENLLWRAPFAGRSTPVVHRGRVYLFNSAGEGASTQERVLCLDAGNGRVLWEYRHNVFHSDVPPRRIAWSSPVVDLETGNVYTYGVAGMMTALTPEGKLVWQRSLIEEFGIFSTHDGRTVSPIIEGDLVIVSSVMSVWGEHAPPRHRFVALDKRNGECVWLSAPGIAPYDTTYSTPVAAEIGGRRVMIAGNADGSVVALKPQTGEPVWRHAISKRGINTGVVALGNLVYVSHGEENLNTSEMGLLAAVDGSRKGELGPDSVRWQALGFLGGYSSPVIHDGVVYQIDNGANLFAFDAGTGARLWAQKLGTIQKASPVVADGKLYVGTENGDFYILKVGRAGCTILDKQRLGTESSPEVMTASPAIADGRVFVVTDAATYCFGKKTGGPDRVTYMPAARGDGAPAHLMVTPTELTLKPGQTVRFTAQLFDEKGRFLSEGNASWSLEGIQGDIDASGRLVVAAASASRAGLIRASVGGLQGKARARVVAPPPWTESFDDRKPGPPPPHWINALGKFQIRQFEGGNVLVKLADNPATQRARIFTGAAGWHDYTVEADIRATERRRQMGDAGIVAQRYGLVLFGNHQKIEIHPWQADPSRSVGKPFAWKGDTWYRAKLRVENLADGQVKVQGKVWPRDDAEPEAWTIEHLDSVPNREGSPGLYASAPFEILFDNYRVTPNP